MLSRINTTYTVDIPQGVFIVGVSICSHYIRGDYFDEDQIAIDHSITEVFEVDEDGKETEINKHHLHWGEIAKAVSEKVRDEEHEYLN